MNKAQKALRTIRDIFSFRMLFLVTLLIWVRCIILISDIKILLWKGIGFLTLGREETQHMIDRAESEEDGV